MKIFNAANMSLNAIRENKIFAKISEFTVEILFLCVLSLYKLWQVTQNLGKSQVLVRIFFMF